MINCDNCGIGIPLRRFLRRFMLGPWTVLRCPSCGALLSASERAELLFGLLAVVGATIGGGFAIYGRERLGWTEPGLLTFAVGAAIAMTTVLAFVIWRHGAYSSRASGIGEFVEGDRATRLKVVAGTAIVLVILLLNHLTFPDAALRATDPMQAFKKSVDHLLILALTAIPFSIAIPIYCLRLAIKVRRSGQWPPPGMRVPVRTRIVRGGRAKLNAILLCFLGTVSIVPGPALIYLWHSSSAVVSELSHPNKQGS
jgi:hypothetical protein